VFRSHAIGLERAAFAPSWCTGAICELANKRNDVGDVKGSEEPAVIIGAAPVAAKS